MLQPWPQQALLWGFSVKQIASVNIIQSICNYLKEVENQTKYQRFITWIETLSVIAGWAGSLLLFVRLLLLFFLVSGFVVCLVTGAALAAALVLSMAVGCTTVVLLMVTLLELLSFLLLSAKALLLLVGVSFAVTVIFAGLSLLVGESLLFKLMSAIVVKMLGGFFALLLLLFLAGLSTAFGLVTDPKFEGVVSLLEWLETFCSEPTSVNIEVTLYINNIILILLIY